MNELHSFSTATPSDVDRLVLIGRVCFPNAPEWNAPHFIIARWWRKIICSADSKVFVLRDDGEAKAFIIYVADESVWDRLESEGPNRKSIKILVSILRPRLLKSRIIKLRKLRGDSTVHNAAQKENDFATIDVSHDSEPEFFAGLMGVDPQFRKRGIGRSLLEACEAMARERGTKIVKIYVDPRNRKAQSIYESMGYAHAGRWHNSLMMTKSLT